MRDIYTKATNPSDSEDEEQLLVVGAVPSSKVSDESSEMKVSSPQKRASVSTESVVKEGKRRGARRQLSCEAQQRTDHTKMSNSDKDLHDEVIVVGRTSTEKREIATAQKGDCNLQERKDLTCRKLRCEASERVSLQNMGQIGVESTLEEKERKQEITPVQLDEHEWTDGKDVPCLAVPSNVTLSCNLSSTSEKGNVEQSTSHTGKKKSKVERIGPLQSKRRRQHHTTNSRRKRTAEEASLEEVHSRDIEDGKKICEQEKWFEILGEREDNEKSSSPGNHLDVNGHLETNNNNADSKDAETSLTRQSSSFSEVDSDDELIDPSLEIDEEDFNEGDLVWARHPRNPFWPAVVKDISSGRQKKITIEYFNQGADVYRCQYSVRAIRPFIQYRKEMLIAGYRSEQSERFKLAVQEAMDYLRERALGKDIALTTPVKEALSDQPNIHSQSFDSPPLTPTDCQTTPLSPRALCSTPEGHHSPPSPKVRIGLSRLFSNSKVTEESNVKEKEKAKLKKKWDKIEDRLVRIILKDETKERLLRIWKGKVKSERHTIFFSSSIKERDNLKYCAHLGALTTEEKIDRIAQHLSEIWKQSCQKNKNDLPNTAYIFEVWLPEAILFAVMKSRKIGLKKAEQVLISEGRQVVKELEME